MSMPFLRPKNFRISYRVDVPYIETKLLLYSQQKVCALYGGFTILSVKELYYRVVFSVS